MSGSLGLSARLAAARLVDARGAGALDVFAVLAYAVSAWLTFVVASGTWMFVQRREHPPQWLVGAAPPDEVRILTTVYVVLAAVACALLVLPILGLGGAAARLGARGRSRRLASLRLVGMTSGEVVRMSIVEAVVQAAVAVVLGAAAWAATLPLGRLITLQSQPLTPGELLLPWWLALGLVALLLLLAAASTALSLTQVRISPLGVSRHVTSPAMRAWRVLALVVGLLALGALSGVLRVPAAPIVVGLLFAGFVAFGIAMMNLFSPWLLQLIARTGLRTGSAARLLAMRRIVADPRAAWRNVSSLSLTGVVAGLFISLPLGGDTFAQMDAVSRMLVTDIRTGALLTLLIAIIVGAAATGLAQGADVVDRADELVALDRMGVSPQVDAAARRHQVTLPLLATLFVSLGLGLLVGAPFLSAESQLLSPVALVMLVVTVGGALGLSLLAAEATRPLRRRALTARVRRND